SVRRSGKTGNCAACWKSMGQAVAAAAFWASHSKAIWRVSADPVGQPVRQNHEFLNRLFIPPLDFQALLHRFGAVSLAIGWQWDHSQGTQLVLSPAMRVV